MKQYLRVLSFILILSVFPMAAFASPAEDQVIEHQTEIITENPGNAVAYFKRGDAYWRKGQYDLAIADETTAIEKNSNYAAAYIIRSICYSSLKNYEAAIKDETKAIELQPNYGLAYRNRAVDYRLLGKYDLSIADCDKSLAIEPKQLRAYYLKGLSLEEKSLNDDAIAAYKKIIELSSTPADDSLATSAKNRIIVLGGTI